MNTIHLHGRIKRIVTLPDENPLAGVGLKLEFRDQMCDCGETERTDVFMEFNSPQDIILLGNQIMTEGLRLTMQKGAANDKETAA